MKGCRWKRAVSQPLRKPTAAPYRQGDGNRRRKCICCCSPVASSPPAPAPSRPTGRCRRCGSLISMPRLRNRCDDLARDVDDVALGQECVRRVARRRRAADRAANSRSARRSAAAAALRMRRRHGLANAAAPAVGPSQPVRPHAQRRFQAGKPRARIGDDLPSRTTSRRSAMPRTSGISDEISRTATPLSARLRIIW